MVIYPSKMLIFHHDITRKSHEITTETPWGKLATAEQRPPTVASAARRSATRTKPGRDSERYVSENGYSGARNAGTLRYLLEF